MRISVIGAGGWGTALSILAARNNRVNLWVRNETEAVPPGGYFDIRRPVEICKGNRRQVLNLMLRKLKDEY